MVRSTKRRESQPKDKPSYHGKKRKSSILSNPFFQLLDDLGFHLADNVEESNEISIDQVVLQQKLNRYLQEDKKMVANVLPALEELWDDPYSLLQTTTSENCKNSSRGKTQDSLLRVLLGVDILQPIVATALLEKLPELSMDDNLASVAMKLGHLDLVHRIVGQLKWLENMTGSKELLEKVFEVISVTDTATQQELIGFLPDLVRDSYVDDVASQLRQLLLDNSNLIPSILDALSNLDLQGDLLDQIRDSVLQILSSANISDLPVVVKFLQQSVNDQNAFDIINELREKLDFNIVSLPTHTSTPFQTRSRKEKSNNHDVMIFDSIKSGLQFQRILSDMWMKVEESIKSSEEQKILDIFILLVLYSSKSRRKVIETMMRNKIKAGIFTEENLTAAFRSYPQVFGEFLNDIILLAEVFLRSPELLISNYGCNIYRQAFCSFDTYSQQEVIGTLVTHIGSGYGPEVEAAFLVLQTLVDEETHMMRRFLVFLKGILDYIDKLSVPQMRILFSMISKLTYDTSAIDDVLNDDLYVLLRKQLSAPVLKYKRIGVIGVMTMISNIAKKKSECLDSTALSNNCFEQVIGLLTLVQNSVKNKSDALTLFYDELASVVEKSSLDEKVLSWISEKVTSDFQEEYLTDADVVKERGEKNLRLAYDLDEPEDGGIAVNILSLILSDVRKKQTSGCSSSANVSACNKLLALPAQFRLIRVCEQQQNNGNLEGIDALLGCPLVLYTDEVTNQILTMNEHDRIVLCTSLIHAINWIRECLNAFTGQHVDADTRGKIISRVKTLTTLNETLERCLTITKNFEMPIVDCCIDEHLLAGIKSLKSLLEAKQFKKPRKSAKRKVKTSNNQTATTENDDAEEGSSDKEEEEIEQDENNSVSDSTFSLTQFPASFRELDLNVFYALSYESVNKAYLDTEMNTKTREELKLETVQITFLLTDLHRKLEHVFASNKRTFLKKSAIKMVGFSNLPGPAEVVQFVLKILPSLCNVLKQCQDYFKETHEKNDGVIDREAMVSEERRDFIALYEVILDLFLQSLQWNGFYRGSHCHLLTSFLTILVKQISEEEVPSQIKLLNKVICSYLAQPVALIPNIRIAVKVIKIMFTMNQRLGNEDEKMRVLLADYLQHTWFNIDGEKESGSSFNETFSFLVKSYIRSAESSIDVIDSFLKGPISELIENANRNDDGTEQNFFPSLYRCLFEELISYVKTNITTAVGKSDSENALLKRLELIQRTVAVFQQLIAIVKETDARNTLRISLKHSRLYLDVFLKSVMPVLDKTLRTHKDIVHTILKSAQQSTRALQHLCGHSKVSKDVSMTTYVPALKKCLEAFVFRVKATLAYNNCDSAFWLGNLKNRDLRGNEILSQTSVDNSLDSDSQADSNNEAESESTEMEEENNECSESF